MVSYTPVFENSYSIRRPLYCATYVSISELSAGNVYDCGHPSYILCNTKTLQTKLFGKRFVSLTHSLYSLPLLVPSLALSFAHSVGRSTERETHTISTVRYIWLLRSPVTTPLLCIPLCMSKRCWRERAAQKRNAENKKSNPLSYRMLHSSRMVLSCESMCICVSV